MSNVQSSPVIWLTGLSGSGKSTICNALHKDLSDRKIKTQILDGDVIRLGLNNDLGFSDDDRKENMRRIAEVAKLFSTSGVITIVAFISPFQEDRDKCKKIIGEDAFVEVHIATPLEICEDRDPKGLYIKARNGEIPKFTGIDSPYEEPESPELKIYTSKNTVEECKNMILDLLIEKNKIEDHSSR